MIKTFNIGGRRFVVDKKLGEGAFGKVYKVRDDKNLQYYAVKEIQVTAGSDIANVEKEINALKTCGDHQGIVTLFDISITNQKVLILMEYCEGGNLNSRLAKVEIANEERDLKWTSELADAVRFLHSKGIVHRDLKPENVLLTSNDAIKLGDFGLAREYTALKQRGIASDQALFQYMTSYMGTQCGTPYWMAPEVFEGRYKESADVFSLGAIFYTILTRQYICGNGGEKFFGAFIAGPQGEWYGVGQAMFKSNSPETVTPTFDDRYIKRSMKDLILLMLKYNTKDRPNASEVYDYVENDVIRLWYAIGARQHLVLVFLNCTGGNIRDGHALEH